MIWKRRTKSEQGWLTPELAQLIVESHVEGATKQARAAERWGVGSSERWSADLATGTISFEFPDRLIAGRVELIGSYALAAGTWLWGWANESVPEPVTGASREVAAVAARPGLELLAQAKLEIPVEVADDLANITVELAGLDGWYRGPSTTNYVYLGFRDLAPSQS